MIGSNQKLLMARAGVSAGGPWDIGGASYSGLSFGIAPQEITPASVFFKPDGSKMYITGTSSDTVHEYSLGTAWDISTSSYFQGFSVSAQEANPQGLFFKPDGTQMFVTGNTGDDVNEYSLSTTWDISTASFVQVFSVAAQETNPVGIVFKEDGSKMYIVGATGDDVSEYSLSIAWDISTASFVQVFSVATEETIPQDIFFKDDGSKMYIVGATGDDVNEYSLSTAWDISTASYSKNFSVAAQDASPTGLFFKPDGTRFYVTGADSDTVYAYDIS